MKMRRPVFGGNWKMHKNIDQALEYARVFKDVIKDVNDADVFICPPFVSLYPLVEAFNDTTVEIGAQNVFWEDKGAFTGEISAHMLSSIGVKYVLVGHSERRQYFSETNETVNKRIKVALRNGLIPLVCVGERLEERESGKTFDVVQAQVRQGLAGLTKDEAGTLLMAYEPVWAIGTGRTATPEIAQETHKWIRGILSDLFGDGVGDTIRILYGGSVNPDNVDTLMAQDDI
ncbi:MAG: triose-phosphate isomerase, partial [Thermodesulfobacteriota bacterium]|nr:triose-phosphate isomerase [Thermodesulfobacteriota bacterium]